MTDGLYLEHNGRRTRLKWHQLRRRLADPVFSPAVMAQGFETGASMEIDLRVRADFGFAVIHDATLERETSGHGPVFAHERADLAALRYRDSGEALTLSEDLGRMLRSAHPDTVLQFDMKSGLSEIGEAGLSHLADIIGVNGKNVIVSAKDLQLMTAMRDRLPGVARGIDPSDEIEEAWQDGGLSAAREALWRALRAPTDAGTIYLHYPLILRADDQGFDMIAACHEAGLLVDAWTFNPADPDAGLTAQERATIRRLVACGADQITTDEALLIAASFQAEG